MSISSGSSSVCGSGIGTEDTSAGWSRSRRRRRYSTSSAVHRQEALDDVGRDAATTWTALPDEWRRNDVEFVLRALQRSKTLPAKSEFERDFDQALRFDRRVVLAWASRPDFTELFEERHLYVPGPLSDDREVVMAYCRKIPRSLQDATDDLCDDADVVEAALTCGGLELQYASTRLQDDADMVRKACRRDGRALELCPPLGQTRRDIIHDRTFMHDVVLAQPGAGSMWKLLPPQLKHQDIGLVLQALKHGLSLRDVPRELFLRQQGGGGAVQEDHAFLKAAIQGKAQLYLELPRDLQRQPAVALQAILAPDSTPAIHSKALDPLMGCPTLKDNRQAVLAICQRGSVEFLQELLQDEHPDGTVPGQPSRFADDLEIMRLAVTRNPALFSVASPRLQALPEMILASITPESALNTIKTVPWTIQRDHIGITVTAVRKCTMRNLRCLPSVIPVDVWQNHRDVCVAWVQRGGRVLEHFESMLRQDQDLALQVAEHNWQEFHKVGPTLLNDRVFLKKAVELEGRVIRHANPILRTDFDLLVIAIAGHETPRSPEAIRLAATHAAAGVTTPPRFPSVHFQYGDITDLRIFQTKIQAKLDLHRMFLLDFLRGIACPATHTTRGGNIPPARRSQLPMLDRGVETSQAFKQLISEFCGVPIGLDLKRLRQAIQNLRRPTPPGELRRTTFVPPHRDDNAAPAVPPPPAVPAAGAGGAVAVAPNRRGGAAGNDRAPTRREMLQQHRMRAVAFNEGRGRAAAAAAVARADRADGAQRFAPFNMFGNLLPRRMIDPPAQNAAAEDGGAAAAAAAPRVHFAAFRDQARRAAEIDFHIMDILMMGDDGAARRGNDVERPDGRPAAVAQRPVNPLAIGLAPERNVNANANLDSMVNVLNADLRAARSAREEAAERDRRRREEEERRRNAARRGNNLFAAAAAPPQVGQQQNPLFRFGLRGAPNNNIDNRAAARPVPAAARPAAAAPTQARSVPTIVQNPVQLPQSITAPAAPPLGRVEPAPPAAPNMPAEEYEAYMRRANELARQREEIIRHLGPDEDETEARVAAARRMEREARRVREAEARRAREAEARAAREAFLRQQEEQAMRDEVGGHHRQFLAHLLQPEAIDFMDLDDHDVDGGDDDDL